MSDPLQALLAMHQVQASLFPPNSRYHGLGTAFLARSDGEPLVYLLRRFVPLPDRFALLQEYVVRRGDRLDKLADVFLQDPEQFWRICDANAAMQPQDLTEKVGRKLRITLPEGIPGGRRG
jgi:hypothetical protein